MALYDMLPDYKVCWKKDKSMVPRRVNGDSLTEEKQEERLEDRETYVLFDRPMDGFKGWVDPTSERDEYPADIWDKLKVQ